MEGKEQYKDFKYVIRLKLEWLEYVLNTGISTMTLDFMELKEGSGKELQKCDM